MSASKPAQTKIDAEKAIRRATKDWRRAKAQERAARDALALVVNEVVAAGLLNENKVASVSDIPRMTIRKMLGKTDSKALEPVKELGEAS